MSRFDLFNGSTVIDQKIGALTGLLESVEMNMKLINPALSDL